MQFNPQQLEAVLHDDGPLLILAGAGSGKTRVLVARMARFVRERGLRPAEICAVTFTNKAAEEMKHRLEGMIGVKARELWVGTFHSHCLKLLRKHAEQMGLSPNFRIFDESDQQQLIKECLAALNLDDKKFPPQSVVQRLSRAKDQCQGPNEFLTAAAGNPYLALLAKLYERYQRRLSELQGVDFGDLIRLTVALFEQNPALLAQYQERWRYLLVDEYQDTNHAQYRLVSLLAKGHQNICVVGDDDQSIYAWRGADIGNILSFERDFPGAKVIRLEQNYRSTQTIINAAAAVIENNHGRKGKKLWTANAIGQALRVVGAATERREAHAVVQRIRDLQKMGKTFGDIAIFYRTNAQSRPFEEVFREAAIPYRIFGGIRFYERQEIKDVLAYLRLLAEPRDDLSLRRIINIPARGIGKGTLDKLHAFAAHQAMTMYEAIPAFLASDELPSAKRKQLQVFHSMIENIRLSCREISLPDLVRRVLEETGYAPALIEQKTLEAEARLENINEFVAAVEEFQPQLQDDEFPRAPLDLFLDEVALVSSADAVEAEGGAVTMMTLHLAKGLEFPAVFMVGLEEGIFPHARSLDDPQALEEERRICYVGMTRAREELMLSYARRRQQYGSTRYAVPSRFLEEIPESFVERIELREESDWNVSSRKFGNSSAAVEMDFDQRPAEEQEGLPYAVGAQVKHPTFGLGQIKHAERSSAGWRVTVRFQNGLTKRLIAECAGLVSF